MNTADVVKLVQANKSASEHGDFAFWDAAVPRVLSAVIDEIVGSYDWDFAMEEDTSKSTVSGTAEYVLSGKNDDLRDVVSIRIGSTVLQRLNAQDADDFLASGSIVGSVGAFYIFKKNTDGFPVATFFDTPGSVKTIKVRYRQSEIKLATFPADFSSLIARGVLAWVDPKNHFGLYRRALTKKIRTYSKGGKDVHIAQMDYALVLGNQKRAALNRVG